jgi:uncharacterized metal-binding protein
MIRWIFGGTNRPHHLKMCHFLTVAAPLIGWYYFPEFGSDFWILVGGGILLQEHWASADRDIEENRKPPNLFWLLYGRRVKHRGWASHGLVIGTIIRLGYGFLGLPFCLVYVDPEIGVAWCLGALINDIGHLLLDL